VTPSERLFSTTTNSRTAYWRVAVHDFARHPVAGSGAGTFVREWYRHRRIRANVTDAHSLYLETLAELGLVGFALLAFVLAVPLVAAARVRGAPFVAGALGAYVAFLAHAAVDWDWELPGVTLAGLFCGGLLVVAARADGRELVLDRRWRTPVLGPVLALIAVSFVGLVGNRAQAAAVAAASRGDWQSVSAQARKAAVWAPWSADALVLQANAADHAGQRDDALALLRRAVGKDANDLGAWLALASAASGRERAVAEARVDSLDPLR
jgi:O-antigen ligase